MRRVGRFLFAFSAVVSLALCVITLVGWRTGASVTGDDADFMDEYRRRLFGVWPVFVIADRNVVGIGILTERVPATAEVHALAASSDDTLWHPSGFHYVNWFTDANVTGTFYFYSSITAYRAVIVPGWFAVSLMGVLPVVYLWSVLRRHRRGLQGMCLVCGYDLRASPERCPECGAERVR